MTGITGTRKPPAANEEQTEQKNTRQDLFTVDMIERHAKRGSRQAATPRQMLVQGGSSASTHLAACLLPLAGEMRRCATHISYLMDGESSIIIIIFRSH